jgi:hypothetical protein
MNSTILNYPGFQDLPKSIRQMLVMSEEYFFGDSQPKREPMLPGHFGKLPPSKKSSEKLG